MWARLLHSTWNLSSQSESESEVTQSCPTLYDPMDCSLHQASPSMGFSRQEYQSGSPFPSSGNLSDPGIEPRSLTLQADAVPFEPPGKPYCNIKYLTSNFTHPNSLFQAFTMFFASGFKMSLISVSCSASFPLLHSSWSLIHHHTNPVIRTSAFSHASCPSLSERPFL